MLSSTLVFCLTSCHKWVPIEPPGPLLREAAQSGSSRTYRIYLPNGTVVEGQPIGLSGDSVVIRAESDTVALAEADIERAQLRKAKVLATVLLTVGIVAAPFLIYATALAIACTGQEKCLS